MTSLKKHKVLKIIGIVILSLIVIIAVAFGIYVYNNTHYWQGDLKKTMDAGFTEKQAKAADGSIINYAEGPDNGKKALLLIHGQTGAWQDYTTVLPELSKNYHVYALDCYGHGKSCHNPEKYNIKSIGDDVIYFINNTVKEDTVISGHSSGGLIASYIAAYGGDKVVGAVLEDPPVFSTEKDYFEKSFAYVDTYKPMHDYLQSEQSECWEAYYLRHCLWGKIYMASSINQFADSAEDIHKKNPNEAVQIFYCPPSLNHMFLYVKDYDLKFGENFYNYSFHSGISHEKLMSDIKVPTVFLHCKDSYNNGILFCASSDEQARKAVSLIKNCELTELVSGHDIHQEHPDVFINACNKLK